MKEYIGRTIQTTNSGMMIIQNTIGRVGKIIHVYERGTTYVVETPNGHILNLDAGDFCFINEAGEFQGFPKYQKEVEPVELVDMAKAMYVNLSNNINIGQIKFPKWEDLTHTLRESYAKTILFLRKIHTVDSCSLSEILECAKIICEKEISAHPAYHLERAKEKIVEAKMWLNNPQEDHATTPKTEQKHVEEK